MKNFLSNFFLRHWVRKLFSLFLAIAIWIVVQNSITETRTISNVAVRITNISPNKTVEGLLSNGLMSKRISLILTGNEDVLEDLTGNDLEVVIDASDCTDEAIFSISKKNLVSLVSYLNIDKDIQSVDHQNMIIRMTNLMTDQIPIFVHKPVGESPKEYKFLDIKPYHLTITAKGPEEVIKHLKHKGIPLTFNLADIKKSDLEALPSNSNSPIDEVSFYIPEEWKKIHIPLLSETALTIDDPKASDLRIDFIHSRLLSLENPIPVVLCFPMEYLDRFNPENCRLLPSELIEEKNGLFFFKKPLFVKGVSSFFLDIVKEKLQMAIVVSPKPQKTSLDWNIQFLSPQNLEDFYLVRYLTTHEEQPESSLQEEYLRNRFRNFMNRFKIFNENDTKLRLKIEFVGKDIKITEAKS